MELIEIARLVIISTIVIAASILIAMKSYDKGVDVGAESIKPVVDRAISLLVKRERMRSNEAGEVFNELKTVKEIGRILGVKVAKSAKK